MRDESMAGVLQRRLFVLGVLVSVVFFFYAFENWRGRRAWERFAREMEARGEQLHWRDFTSKSVPIDENFMAAPVMEAIAYNGESDPGLSAKIKGHPLAHYSFDCARWKQGQPLDLGACQAFLRGGANDLAMPNSESAALDVLHALSSLDAEFSEMRQAADRRFSQCRGGGDPSRSMPNFAALRTLAYLLALRTSAELAVARTNEAFADAWVLGRAAEALTGEPHLVGAMMGAAMVEQMGLQTFWEGLARAAWSDQQLRRFESMFRSIDLLRALDRALRAGERAGVNYLVQQQTSAGLNDLFRPTPRGPGLAALMEDIYYRAWPRGWMYQNQVVHNRLLTETALSGYDLGKQQVYPEKCRDNNAALHRTLNSRSPFVHLAAVGIPNFQKATETAARIQTWVNQAALACALELYRRERNDYPASLAALVPRQIESLPHDLITGAPLIYQRLSRTEYLLYSVGWDEVDDGGRPVETSTPTQGPGNGAGGDWVWPVVHLTATSQ